METPLAKTSAGLPATVDQGFTGLQDAEQGDTIRLPRLIMPQDKSKIIKEQNVKAGTFINTLTFESYGPQVEVVPLLQRKNTRIRWPEQRGGGFMCINRNRTTPSGDPGDSVGTCEACPMYQDFDAKTGCTDNYEIVALVKNDEDPRFWEAVLITAESKRPSDSGYRDIIGIARIGAPRGIKLWHKSYTLKAISASNKFGDFYKVTAAAGNNNQVLPADIIQYLDTQVAFWANVKIEANHADAEAAPVPAGDPDGVPKNW